MQRERLTITLEPELVAAADGLVDRSAIRNRSHAIEHLMKEGLGLHLLRQAFLFADKDWSQERLSGLLSLCANQDIETAFLCVPTSEAGMRSDLRAVISAQAPSLTVKDVPLDFGDGGAVLLQKESLAHPFLLAWLSSDLALPESLVGAYAAHRGQQNAATQLLVSAEGGYRPAGLAVASPALLPHIPAGIVRLAEDVFPDLLKKRTLGTYAFSL